MPLIEKPFNHVYIPPNQECKIEKPFNHVYIPPNQECKLTALLCIACNEITDSGYVQSEELQEWYDEHRAADLKNMDDLICFASDMASKLTKEDFDSLDKFLTTLRANY
jgi:hypothetical protein